MSHLFPVGKRKILYKEPSPDKKRKTYCRVESMDSGALFAECAHCTKASRPIADFAPADTIKTHRKSADFLKVVDDYTEAYAARNLEAAGVARERVAELRREKCPPCVKTDSKLSPAQQACKNFWISRRQEMCDLHDGCMKQGCPMKGADRDWRVLQGDHIEPANKVHKLSDYKWWAGNGGVPKMRLEAAKCQWICGFCHVLEPTSLAGKRCGDPVDMPDGKWDGTTEEKKQHNAKHKAKIRYPKHQYVDAAKLRIGCCARCNRGVTPETCVAFQFDHVDEATKMKGNDTLAGGLGGVGGLVSNDTKRAALDVVYDAQGKIQYDDHGVICVRDSEFKRVLDAEMAKCQLLCANCHKLKTWDGEGL